MKRAAPTQKIEKSALLRIFEAEDCRRSLKRFAMVVWPIVEPMPFVDGRVIDAICEHLEAVARGEIRKMVINIPPRHTKSLLLVIWRAWLWANTPTEQILAASYSFALSLRDNMRVRRIIEDPWFQSHYGATVTLSPDQNVKGYFENTAGGYQMAMSVDGGTTGHGGSVLIVDDMHNATEAHSEAERVAATTWFREVWTNRLNDQKRDKMVVVGQRIHENDVCGYILAERPDWVHLNLPALYEPDRTCVTSIGWQDWRTHEGELLWPERFSRETLEGLKRDLGSAGFAAQYQQTPIPSGGGQFKEQWMRYCSQPGDVYALETPEGVRHVPIASCWLFAVVDVAISLKQDADYTVIQTWAVTPEKDLLLIDQTRGHFDNPDQQKMVVRAYQQHIPSFVQIETVAYQLALFQQLLRQGIPVKEYQPVRDKVSRASTAAVYMEAGKIYFLKTLPELAEIKMELLRFPLYAHDDIVDCVSQAADVVSMPGPSGGMLIPTIDEESTGLGWF